MKIRTRIIGLLAAIALLAGGLIAATAQQAAAYSSISSWSWNTRNIIIEDAHAAHHRVTLRPGQSSQGRTDYVHKRVYIPSGCRGYWSSSTSGSWLAGGQWNTLSYTRAHFGGRIYLQEPPGVANRQQCNHA